MQQLITKFQDGKTKTDLTQRVISDHRKNHRPLKCFLENKYPSLYLKYLKNIFTISWKFIQDNINYFVSHLFHECDLLNCNHFFLLYGIFFKLCKFLHVLLLTKVLVQLLVHHLPDEHLQVICQFCRPWATKPLWEWGSLTITKPFLSGVAIVCTRPSFFLCTNKLGEHERKEFKMFYHHPIVGMSFVKVISS